MQAPPGPPGGPTKEGGETPMIVVELRRTPEGEHDYVTVATLTVTEDGRHQVEDPEDLFPTIRQLHVLLPGDPGQHPRRVTFEDDPVTWARNLHTILRTGYLVPVVTTDTLGGAITGANHGAAAHPS